MKRSLENKYAATGLSAHRQRLTASPNSMVTKQIRDQAALDCVTARLLQSARPKKAPLFDKWIDDWFDQLKSHVTAP